jgi:hypothetical protein
LEGEADRDELFAVRGGAFLRIELGPVPKLRGHVLFDEVPNPLPNDRVPLLRRISYDIDRCAVQVIGLLASRQTRFPALGVDGSAA